MPYREKNIEKVFYSISEVAEMFGVAPSLIRFWESEFESLRPRKNQKGNRQFSKEDIEELKLIYHLVKEKGFTIPGAREKLRLDRKKAQDRLDAIQSLQKIRSFLLEIKKDLDNSSDKGHS